LRGGHFVGERENTFHLYLQAPQISMHSGLFEFSDSTASAVRWQALIVPAVAARLERVEIRINPVTNVVAFMVVFFSLWLVVSLRDHLRTGEITGGLSAQLSFVIFR
jgi:hypothetical protein